MTKNNSTLRKIYIASDALWDLRQGTLTKINAAWAAEVTSQTSYYTRDEDKFATPNDALSPEVYARVFEKYKHQILSLSLRTEILSFVLELCGQYVKQIGTTPFLSAFELEINTYPFTLSDEESKVLLDCLVAELTDFTTIRLAHITPAQLTIAKVKEEYASMVLYNYHDWLNLHTEELKTVNLKEVGLYVPRMYFANKAELTDDFRRELKKRGKDEFELLAEVLKPFVHLQFLPVALYSASTPVNTPELRQLIKKA